MTVRVCDLRDNKECKYVGKAETHFKITGMCMLVTLI